MEFRKIFDTIPEQFDKFRPRYSQELFDNLIDFAKIGPEKKVLKIGPGTYLLSIFRIISTKLTVKNANVSPQLSG